MDIRQAAPYARFMIEQYLMGSCHHLAVAMHRLTGWKLAATVGMNRGDLAIFHVFCLAPDGMAWDARGETHPRNMTDEHLEDFGETWIVPLDGEPAVWRMSTSDPDALLYRIHETHVLDALGFVDDILDGKVSFVSDGWRPADPQAIERARGREIPMPKLDRDAALDLETSVSIVSSKP